MQVRDSHQDAAASTHLLQEHGGWHRWYEQGDLGVHGRE